MTGNSKTKESKMIKLNMIGMFSLLAAGEDCAQLKEALKKYVQARLAALNGLITDNLMKTVKKSGVEMEAELDKVSAQLTVKK